MQQKSMVILNTSADFRVDSKLHQLNNLCFFSFHARNTYKASKTAITPTSNLPHELCTITCFSPAVLASNRTSASLPLSLLAHLLSMELGQFLLVFGGGGALVLLVVEEFLHLLPVAGPQLLQRSPLLRLKLGLCLAERPQLLLKIPTHLLHLLEPPDIFCSVSVIPAKSVPVPS